MALAAQQVITALAALLGPQAGLGAGGIKTSRTWPWAESDLPAVRVYAGDEAVEQAGVDRINRHLLSVDVQYSARATADLDATLNALAASAGPLLFAEPVPYALQLTGITRTLATEGEAAVGQITLQLQASYFVAPAAPEVIL